MRNQSILSLFFLFCCLHLQAQEIPEFGNITTEEKQLSACEFDKDASAIILLDEGLSNYDKDYNLVNFRHVRIKILKENGLSAGNISIPYYRINDFETIFDIEAGTYNVSSDGGLVIKMVEKKSFYTAKMNDYIGEIQFSFPSVKKGSILEYRYRSVMRHYGGLRDWHFQQELPVLHSKYNLYIPPGDQLTYKFFKRKDFPIVIKPNKQNGSIYFEMSAVPGLREEPYMDARSDYLQRVIFQLGRYKNKYGKDNLKDSWNDVARDLRNESKFGRQIEKKISGSEEALIQARSISDLQTRIHLIYEYVRSKMIWNGRNGIRTNNDIMDAWQKGNGNIAEINLLLVGLLKAAGLEAYPALVSERSNGKIDAAYPFTDQFHDVFASVKIQNQFYYLDATDKFTPSGLTPYKILNTTCLLILPKEGLLLTITNDSLQSNENNNISLTVNSEGEVQGQIAVSSVGYSKSKKQIAYSDNKEKFLDNYFKDIQPGVTISKNEVTNEARDTLPFQQKCNFTFSLPRTDKYFFLSLNYLPGFKTNSFISDDRFSDINFEFSQSIGLSIYLQLPDQYNIEAIPASVKLTNPEEDMTFTRKIFYDKEKNRLACKISIEIKRSIYSVDNYKEIQEFYKKMFALLNEQVVMTIK
jgi:Domain of Unknown Function with PDB structure (DUF3857)